MSALHSCRCSPNSMTASMSSRKRLTRRLSAPRDADFDPGSLCIFASPGTEERARGSFWDDRLRRAPDTCTEIVAQEAGHLLAKTIGRQETVALRDGPGLQALFRGRESVYVDISGLSHHVWAPLLREALSTLRTVWVVYVEPERYRPHPSPASAIMFDLSSSIGGVAPLPGFANLRGPKNEKDALFVPLLGFEGTRARQVAMTLDPVPEVVAIVGAPGFRAEYPSVTVACNQDFLDDYKAHSKVRIARASCPFEAYDALVEIRRDHPGSYLYVAPIGTKPHALGALMYAIDYPSTTEVMYDHPVRKANRTYGTGIAHVYCVKDE